jgi:hypothetical protein
MRQLGLQFQLGLEHGDAPCRFRLRQLRAEHFRHVSGLRKFCFSCAACSAVMRFPAPVLRIGGGRRLLTFGFSTSSHVQNGADWPPAPFFLSHLNRLAEDGLLSFVRCFCDSDSTLAAFRAFDSSFA